MKRYQKAIVCALLTTLALPSKAGPPSSIVLASQNGAFLDANLQHGGGHDDTSALQRILDRAKTGHGVQLVIDGPARISGLDVYSNTTIECAAGGGPYLADNANRAMIRNGHRSRGEIDDENIAIRGCYLNGNRDNQRIGAPKELGRYLPVEPDGKTPQSGLQFFGVEHLSLQNVSLYHIRSFSIHIANARYIDLSNVTVDTGLPPYPYKGSLAEQQAYVNSGVNDDGIHFNGPIQYLSAQGLRLRTIDDALALNANDGSFDDATVTNEMGPYLGQGPITDVNIRDVLFTDSHEGVRLLSRNQRIDRISMEGLNGTVRERVVLLSHFMTTQTTGDYGTLSFSNISVQPVGGPEYLETYPWLRDLFLNGPNHWDVVEDAKRPVFAINSPVQNLILNNVSVSPVDKRPLIWIGPDAVVGNLSADLKVDDPAQQTIPLELAGHVQRLSFALDWVGKNPILNSGGKIDKLTWARGSF